MTGPPAHFGAGPFGAPHNFFPPPHHMMAGMGGMGPPGAGGMMPPQEAADEASSAKRAKFDEQALVDEAEWLRRHGNQGPVSVAVVCPAFADKPEWRLGGQTMSIMVDLTDSVSFSSFSCFLLLVWFMFFVKKVYHE